MSPTVARRAARLAVVAALLLPAALAAQVPKPDSQPAVPAAKPDSQPAPVAPKKWYDRIAIRGYAQVRYNRIFADNPDYYCPACDRTVGFPGGISIRRARLIVQGGLSDQVQVKLETDVVVTVGNDLNFLQLRELFGDVFVDKAHTGQARLGLAKVPYGFDNLQSSSVPCHSTVRTPSPADHRVSATSVSSRSGARHQPGRNCGCWWTAATRARATTAS
jgi:hypothetical protein